MDVLNFHIISAKLFDRTNVALPKFQVPNKIKLFSTNNDFTKDSIIQQYQGHKGNDIRKNKMLYIFFKLVKGKLPEMYQYVAAEFHKD